MTDKSRRQFLQMASTGLAVGLAGCSAISEKIENVRGTPEPTLGPNDPGNPFNESYNRTDTPKPVEVPEGGYINRTTGKIKQETLKDARPIEYIFAAEEAYRLGQELLQIAFQTARIAYNSIEGKNPELEKALKMQDQAYRATKGSIPMHNRSIKLLKQVDETNAINEIKENIIVVKKLVTVFEELGTIIKRYQQGDQSYVANNIYDNRNRYKTLKSQNKYWSAIVPYITHKHYNG